MCLICAGVSCRCGERGASLMPNMNDTQVVLLFNKKVERNCTHRTSMSAISQVHMLAKSSNPKNLYQRLQESTDCTSLYNALMSLSSAAGTAPSTSLVRSKSAPSLSLPNKLLCLPRCVKRHYHPSESTPANARSRARAHTHLPTRKPPPHLGRTERQFQTLGSSD